jgi:hypothetical protein
VSAPVEGERDQPVCRQLTKRGWLYGEKNTTSLMDSASGDDGLDAKLTPAQSGN